MGISISCYLHMLSPSFESLADIMDDKGSHTVLDIYNILHTIRYTCIYHVYIDLCRLYRCSQGHVGSAGHRLSTNDHLWALRQGRRRAKRHGGTLQALPQRWESESESTGQGEMMIYDDLVEKLEILTSFSWRSMCFGAVFRRFSSFLALKPRGTCLRAKTARAPSHLGRGSESLGRGRPCLPGEQPLKRLRAIPSSAEGTGGPSRVTQAKTLTSRWK